VASGTPGSLCEVHDLCDQHSEVTVFSITGDRGHLDLPEHFAIAVEQRKGGEFLRCILFEREDSREQSRNVREGCGEETETAREQRGTGEENTKNRERGESGGPCRVSGTPPTVLKEEGRLRDSSVEAI
jgi:hypothetical protein